MHLHLYRRLPANDCIRDMLGPYAAVVNIFLSLCQELVLGPALLHGACPYGTAEAADAEMLCIEVCSVQRNCECALTNATTIQPFGLRATVALFSVSRGPPDRSTTNMCSKDAISRCRTIILAIAVMPVDSSRHLSRRPPWSGRLPAV